MALHPDMTTVATGQVAGHDKLDGKVVMVGILNKFNDDNG